LSDIDLSGREGEMPASVTELLPPTKAAVRAEKIETLSNSCVEPLACTLDTATVLSGLSRSKLYEAIQRGTLDAVKAGGRTLILYASLKRYVAALPPA
jgi:excisionase family DNA binding protein